MDNKQIQPEVVEKIETVINGLGELRELLLPLVEEIPVEENQIDEEERREEEEKSVDLVGMLNNMLESKGIKL